ncbi:MAG: DUF167 domain-containing protein [Gemmatimonadaceae bacterium]
MSALDVRESNGRVRFSVRVQPRAAADGFAGTHGTAIKIRLNAAPVDGAANERLVKFLSATFAVPRRSIKILAGERSRVKIIEIEGVTERDVYRLAQDTDR